MRARLADDGFLSPDDGMLAILLGDRHVGRVEWFARSWGTPATSSCWEIAIGVGAEHRGQGIGSTAQDLLARYLFEHTRAEGVQASTDVENLAERRTPNAERRTPNAERRAPIKAGFQEEGTARRAQWRAGAWHDMVLYSRLREVGKPRPLVSVPVSVPVPVSGGLICTGFRLVCLPGGSIRTGCGAALFVVPRTCVGGLSTVQRAWKVDVRPF